MTFHFFGREFEFFTSQRQVDKFLTYLNNYFLKPSVLVALVLTIIFLLVIRYYEERDEKIYQLVLQFSPILCIFWYFSIYVIGVSHVGSNLKLQFDELFVNDNKLHETTIITFVINCIVFIPYGILIQKYWKSSWRNILIICITGLLIEEFQFLSGRGTASASDLLSYALGGMIGLLIARLCSKKE